MFQFPGFAHSHECSGSSIHWVAPFGDARINSCLQIPEPFRSLPRPSSPPDSLGILRSLLSSFSLCAFNVIPGLTGNLKMPDGLGHDGENTVNHIFLCLLLPIEIVVRKFRIKIYRLNILSFALPLIYSLKLVKELPRFKRDCKGRHYF